MPLAIDLGLLRGRLYAAESLQKLVAGLRRRPDMAELRRVMSEAPEDDSLQIGWWHDARAAWLDADHQTLALPAAGEAHRAMRLLHDADQCPIAALVFDRGLLEEPLLLDTVASSMHSALHGHQVEAALSRTSASGRPRPPRANAASNATCTTARSSDCSRCV